MRLSLSLCFQKHAEILPKAFKAFCPFPAKAPPGVCSGFACVLSRIRDWLWPHGLYPAKLLCPWDSPGKNTGVGRHALLQGIFLIQESNLSLLCLLHWQVCSLPLVPPGKPKCWIRKSNTIIDYIYSLHIFFFLEDWHFKLYGFLAVSWL